MCIIMSACGVGQLRQVYSCQQHISIGSSSHNSLLAREKAPNCALPHSAASIESLASRKEVGPLMWCHSSSSISSRVARVIDRRRCFTRMENDLCAEDQTSYHGIKKLNLFAHRLTNWGRFGDCSETRSAVADFSGEYRGAAGDRCINCGRLP